MDLSSFPEDQRQQLQQLQELFQEHQQQQQQQQQQIQDYASLPYDPTQVQPYDPSSYYAYYQYQDPQQSQQQYPQQEYDQYHPQEQQPQQHQNQNHHYAYCQSDYANAYQQQPESAAISEALPQTESGGAVGAPAVDPGYPIPPGLNPAVAAALAALSQLTQFAGTMEAAEKAMARGGGYGPMVGPASGFGPYMGPGPMHHGSGPFRPPVGWLLI
ncbi:hypothetical protein Acr_25g0009310 [Actinidia rufa]|uniref:Uncharacterized protein n=1 Tax=Actinidia rufa TaxID=165716 RepID=A0A7J0H0H1_9ERIC|nr:hypothetical protein Acr_25g0009310 [Actinidia rufa]